jgi:hypothetical protein
MTMLADRGEWVVEVDRPKRPARRGGKTDALDAVRAAREALRVLLVRDIRRCLKRAVARQLFKLLQGCDQPGVEVTAGW